MGKRLDCKEILCDYSVCAQTEDEVIKKAWEHVQTIHKMRGFSKEFYNKALASIYLGPCEKELSPDELLCKACVGVCTC